MKKAIKINVESKTIEYVKLGGGLQPIYDAIGNGCGTFCIPFTFENNDSIYADDEALLRENEIKGGFFFEEWQRPIVGNGLIVGTDANGEIVDCVATTEEIEKQVFFISEYTCKQWAKEWMNEVESLPKIIIPDNQ